MNDYDDDSVSLGSALGIRYEESVIAQRLIGAAMRDPAVMKDLLAMHFDEDDLLVDVLRAMWSTCVDLFKETGSCEPMLVEASLIAQGHEDEDVREVMRNAGVSALDKTDHDSLAGYVARMRKRIANRRLSSLGETLARDARKEGANPAVLATFVRHESERIIARALDVTGADSYELGTIAINLLHSDAPPVPTVPLGIPLIDSALGGGAPIGTPIVVSAGTGVGKSTFALHFIKAALDAGEGVVPFVFESDRAKMTRKLIELYAGVRFPNDRKKLSRTDESRLNDAAGVVSTLRLWIEDESSLTVEEVVARMRQYRRKHGARVFLVDYVQDIDDTPGVFGASHAQHARKSKTLRKAAKDEGIVVIEFSQVSPPPAGVKRAVEGEDTAGSKQYAKDAGAIIIAERDKEAEDERRKNLNRLRLVKNREFGVLVEAWMRYDSATTRLRPVGADGEEVTRVEVDTTVLDVPYVDDGDDA
jgi:replicative DNA helicase